MNKSRAAGAALVLVVVVLATVGTAEYEDEQRELESYCAMVAAGNWPDYRGIYDEECE